MEIFLGTLFIVICVLLVIVVLLQKGRGGGLGSAFGGASTSAFGTRTGDVFTWVTIVLTALFLLIAIVTTLALRPPPMAVAPPQFSPPINVIEEPTSITLSCNTSGAKIHYTTDGSEPTEESPLYEKTAVEVRPGMILTARAFKAGWQPSPVITAQYMTPSEAAAASQPAPVEGIEIPVTAPPQGTAGG